MQALDAATSGLEAYAEGGIEGFLIYALTAVAFGAAMFAMWVIKSRQDDLRDAQRRLEDASKALKAELESQIEFWRERWAENHKQLVALKDEVQRLERQNDDLRRENAELMTRMRQQ